MSLKLKFKGRTFSSPASFAKAVERDLNQQIERNVKRVAAGTGPTVKKVPGGFEIKGSLPSIARFKTRLEK